MNSKISKTQPTEKNTQPLWALYLISILCGAIMMSLEIVGGRLLSPFFGSSVYVWGSIISIFLIALSSGYYLGGLLADKKPSISLLGLVIAASGLLITTIPSLTAPLVKALFNAGIGNSGPLIVSLALFFLPSLGLGIVSPFIVKLGARETTKLGNVVGKFSAVSTFGSIIGTLATTFILIPSFGVREVINSLGVTLLIMSAIILVFRKRFWPGLAVSVLLIATLTTGVLQLPALHAEEPNETGLIYKKESLYNNITVRDEDNIRYMGFDGIDQSAMNKMDPTSHIWPYTRIMDGAANYYHPQAETALLIGLGGGTLPKAMLAKRTGLSMDAVEIDPEVVKISYDYFKMPKSDRLKVSAVDGRVFLQSQDKKYDVIMVDAFNRASIPYHLTTKEFFEELDKSLHSNGVVIFNVISSIEGEHSTFFKSLLTTANQVFPERRLFQAEGYSPYELDNLILIVSKKPLASPGQLADGKEYQEAIDLSSALMLTDNYAPVETQLSMF